MPKRLPILRARRSLSSPAIRLLPKRTTSSLPIQADLAGASGPAWHQRAQRSRPDPRPDCHRGRALWRVKAHACLATHVIVSAMPPFNVGQHALCWVHAERLVHKLTPFTRAARLAQQQQRKLIWRLLRTALKRYCRDPDPNAGCPRSRFDRIYVRAPHRLLSLSNQAAGAIACQQRRLLMVSTGPRIPAPHQRSENGTIRFAGHQTQGPVVAPRSDIRPAIGRDHIPCRCQDMQPNSVSLSGTISATD